MRSVDYLGSVFDVWPRPMEMASGLKCWRNPPTTIALQLESPHPPVAVTRPPS
ncbi:unnamed protein product, partial [Nesidiocoris tenuis]